MAASNRASALGNFHLTGYSHLSARELLRGDTAGLSGLLRLDSAKCPCAVDRSRASANLSSTRELMKQTVS